MILIIDNTLVVLLIDVASILIERLLEISVRMEMINPNGTKNEMIEKIRAQMSLFFVVIMVSSRMINCFLLLYNAK